MCVCACMRMHVCVRVCVRVCVCAPSPMPQTHLRLDEGDLVMFFRMKDSAGVQTRVFLVF